MKRFKILTITLCFSVLLMGGISPTPANSGTMDLITTLVDALGITDKQAEGGVGALFNNAKKNLSTEDFNKASEAVPGVDKYMAEAPSTDSDSGVGGLLKSSGLSSLGGSASKIGSMAGLADSFSKLGMNAETMTKFIPIVTDFMESKAGSGVAGLLKGLWQ
ncbi:MAG: hypothetical protein B6240_09345 [Desulfobacteraceae bacterium 4572_87]|nr:MAG: hypothetical protein B6240_09345 [Desulfobacteraceae bacterium 4572_87]